MKPNEQKEKPHGHTQAKAPAEAEEFIATSDLPERIEDSQVRAEKEKRSGPPPAADRPPAATDENRYRPGDQQDDKPLNQQERKQPRGDGREKGMSDDERAVLEKDTIDEASVESFPASDAPSHTGITSGPPEGSGQLESPVMETPQKPATPRSVQKTRRREKDRGRKGS